MSRHLLSLARRTSPPITFEVLWDETAQDGLGMLASYDEIKLIKCSRAKR
ncbi:MAG TPA: hypothetical protein VH601_00435 [Bryobacteraceae bacterium]